VAGKGTPGPGATFTIAERRSRSVTRSGRSYYRVSAKLTDDTPEPTTKESTPGPTPGSADTPARTSHLQPGDLIQIETKTTTSQLRNSFKEKPGGLRKE